jgi:rod shape-determining protein MreC
VGQIASLSPHYAKVITILESNMAVGVISQRTRVQGIFVGSGVNMGKIKYIMKDEDIKVGDLFITSGVDGIFPKGICVGKVTSVFNHKMDIFKEITLKTSVDFSRLEEVLILLKSTDWSLFNEQG